MGILDSFKKLLGLKPLEELALKTDPNKIDINALPPGRVSSPNVGQYKNYFDALDEGLVVVDLNFDRRAIPVIRKLVKVNPNYSQAVNSLIKLSNTGHKINFDDGVEPDMVDEMRRHLYRKKLEWSEGTAGMDSLINKMLAQALITGAVSNEWIPDIKKTGIRKLAFVNPEDVVFIYDRENDKFMPYQRLKDFSDLPKSYVTTVYGDMGFRKLNENTYKYYAINGDEELPYGYPPFMAALEATVRQSRMLENMDFIIDQFGVIGFLEALVNKPQRRENQTDAQYRDEMDKILTETKKRILNGYRDGVIVGFEKEHLFKFNAIPKTGIEAFKALFTENELQMLSGLLTDGSLLGRSYGTSETQITVVFTKMLSEIKNLQNIIKRNLEYGYSLELRLAGFKFEYLTVDFHSSTLTDELKLQQSKEIKLRNLRTLFRDGIISQETYADEMGYTKPDLDGPRYLDSNIQEEEEARKKREAQKDESDRRSRDRNRPQPKNLK
jgi:hypothetical protein